MAITNYPKVLKYAIDDRPYYIPQKGFKVEGEAYNEAPPFWNGRGRGFIRRVIITGWRTEVYSNDGLTPVQENFYTVKEIINYDPAVISSGQPFEEIYEEQRFEIEESKLFSSSNAALMSLTPNRYFNYAYNADTHGSDIFRNWGLDFEDNAPRFEDWADFAGMDFTNAQLGTIEVNNIVGFVYLWNGTAGVYGYTGGEVGQTPTLIFDYCNLTGVTFPAEWDTKSEFRSVMFSYDAKTTIWKDGFPIGRAATGNSAGTSGLMALTGTGTQFVNEFCEGDTIIIETVGEFVIDTITDATHLTVTTAFPGTFTGKGVSRL
jgi:hypothetical protein